MRFVKQKDGGQKNNNALNIPVRITGFIEEGDQIGAQGINVLTGQQVTAWLTTTGKAAENESRLSIRKLRDGHNVSRTTYTLVEGGLVSFKSAFPKTANSDQFWATWANVLAYNHADFEKYVLYAPCAILTMHGPTAEDSPAGAWGRLAVYPTKPEAHMAAPTPEALYEGIKEHATSWIYPTFLIRLLDGNGKVLGFTSFWKTWMYTNSAKTQGRDLTPAELASDCVDHIKAEMANYSSAVAINIVPGKRYNVSARQLESLDRVKHWKLNATSFYKVTKFENEIVYDYYCKEVFAKLGGVRNEFVNWVQPVNPNKDDEGIDPVLLGGLEYSVMLDADKAEGSEQEQPAAPEQQKDANTNSPADHSEPQKQEPAETQNAPVESQEMPSADQNASFEPPTEESAPLEDDPWKALDNSSMPPNPEQGATSSGFVDDGFGGKF